MATPISSDAPKAQPALYAEQDKLGPLGGKRSILDDEGELRRTLVAEFQATADAARVAAASVARDPVGAVHEYRKALRRARAVLGLVAHALPRNERRAVETALKEARRALGAVRDQAVIPEALETLDLDEVERATADAIVGATAESIPPPAEIEQLLAEGAARTAAQVEALEAALPRQLAWDVVERGIRDTYDAGRRARKAAKRSKRAFHTWRRRSKELSCQLDLLAGYAGERMAELHRELSSVTDAQGPAVDLIMLRDLVLTHSAGVAPDAAQRLTIAIETKLDDLVAAARRAGRDVFRRKPRKFVRRVTKRMRRDAVSLNAPEDVD
jgi:CHAD domain-containing protein